MTSKNYIAEKIFNNPKIKEILEIEPRLIPIIAEAEKQKNVKGYDRVRTYIQLRNMASKLVGLTCDNQKLKNKESYDLIRTAIDNLLPPDNVDIEKIRA